MRQELLQLRFSYEGQLFDAIRRQLGDEMTKKGDKVVREQFHARKRHLLGDAVRITADLAPEINAEYQTCLGMLGADLVGDLYVIQSSDYNANVLAHGKRFDLLMHSSMLRDFSMPELRFVIGHELGHVIFEHSTFSIHEVFEKKQGQVDAGLAHNMFSWSRAAEVSADRIGLLCCGSMGQAVTALFKTSSGLPGVTEEQVLRSFRAQYQDLVGHIGDEGQGHEWIRTHPMMPIRFKAIELAALDVMALRASSRGFSSAGFRRIDREIASILEALDKSGQPRVKALPQQVQQLACLVAVLWVALCDGEMDFEERTTLTDIHMHLGCDFPIGQVLDPALARRTAFLQAAPGELQSRKNRLHPDDVTLILTLAASMVMRTSGNIGAPQQDTLQRACFALGGDASQLAKALTAAKTQRPTVRALLR